MRRRLRGLIWRRSGRLTVPRLASWLTGLTGLAVPRLAGLTGLAGLWRILARRVTGPVRPS
ncbi:MAG: hypothetical protein M3Y44_03785 [Actinomycetota bacterium]|nr:hypothetical protein [Actinomycetota bacterium]